MEIKGIYQAKRSNPPEDRNPPQSKSNVNPPPKQKMEFPDFIPNPLHHSPEGVIKFNGSRVTLHSVLWAFKTGETPEGIIECFPTLALADVYSAIAYYLHNKEEVETYLSQQEQEAKEMREVWEAEYPPKVSREELQARRFGCDQVEEPIEEAGSSVRIRLKYLEDVRPLPFNNPPQR